MDDILQNIRITYLEIFLPLIRISRSLHLVIDTNSASVQVKINNGSVHCRM